MREVFGSKETDARFSSRNVWFSKLEASAVPLGIQRMLDNIVPRSEIQRARERPRIQHILKAQHCVQKRVIFLPFPLTKENAHTTNRNLQRAMQDRKGT